MISDNDEFYQLVVKGANAGLWDWENVNESVVQFSELFNNLLGYTENGLPNTFSSFLHNIHPDEQEKFTAEIQDHLKNKTPFKYVHRLKMKNESYRWFQIMGHASWDSSGLPLRMAGCIIDITNNVLSKNRLRAQYAFTKVLAESIEFSKSADKIVKAIIEGLEWDVGILWLYDKKNNCLQPKSIWHHSHIEVHPFIEFTKKTTFPPGIGLAGVAFKNKEVTWITDVATEHSFIRKQQATVCGLHGAFAFPVYTHKEILGVVECFSQSNECFDPSLVKVAMGIGSQLGQYILHQNDEKKLHEAEAYKTAILESALNGILTLDKDNVIQSSSPRAAQTFEYTVNEMIGKDLKSLIPAFNLQNVISHPNTIEMLGINSSGDSFPIELSASKYQSESNTLYIIAIRDITERKKIEQLKNEFISNVSHELRTPLTSIRGSIGLIMSGVGGNLSPKSQNLLEIAHKNCERLILIINDILDMEKIESGKMCFQIKWLNLKDIIQEAVELNQAYSEKFNVKIVVNEPIVDCQIRIDQDRFMQVMTNLISNAVKYSPSGNIVEITTTNSDDFVRISVTDHGLGIPESFRSRIFGKFAQADSSNTKQKGGTGLGLNITRAIVGQFGGRISFTSEEGKGATFFVELPKVPEPIITSNLEKVDSSSRLLICEDDEEIAHFLKATLEKKGFFVDLAFSGDQAKTLLDRYEYSVIALDLALPDMSGMQLIQDIRNQQKTNKTPVIVISAQVIDGKKVLKGDTLDVIDWITKPIDAVRLMNAIKKVSSIPVMPNILYVEDDLDIVQIITYSLSNTAKIIHAPTLSQAKSCLMKENVDLILLDLSLPDGSGLKLLEDLDPKHPKPVIIFSATEVTPEISEKVSAALVKAKTSESTLVTTIASIISHNSN